jgi:cytochrome oxidase Cu insertion factor (SCO1/SenC/PrrC family)
MAISARNLAACVLFAAAAPAYAAITIQAFEPDTLEQIVAKQKGKPFVLVVWSLDCEYCQASLKTLSQEKRKRKDLQVVTLATDPLADPQAVALMKKKLEAVGMSSNAWAYGNAPPEQLRYVLDRKWHGEKPRSYWFNAQGERVAYSGVITAETIAKMTAR